MCDTMDVVVVEKTKTTSVDGETKPVHHPCFQLTPEHGAKHFQLQLLKLSDHVSRQVSGKSAKEMDGSRVEAVAKQQHAMLDHRKLHQSVRCFCPLADHTVELAVDVLICSQEGTEYFDAVRLAALFEG